MIAVIDEAPDAVTLRLRLSEATGFLPGQYYNVRLEAPGRPRPVQRAYSLCSGAPRQGIGCWRQGRVLPDEPGSRAAEGRPPQGGLP